MKHLPLIVFVFCAGISWGQTWEEFWQTNFLTPMQKECDELGAVVERYERAVLESAQQKGKEPSDSLAFVEVLEWLEDREYFIEHFIELYDEYVEKCETDSIKHFTGMVNIRWDSAGTHFEDDFYWYHETPNFYGLIEFLRKKRNK